VSVFPAAPAQADFSTSVYTHKGGSNCSSAVDPINFGFYGPAAWWSNAAAHVQHHSGWNNTSGSTQANRAHGTCYSMGTQRASGSSLSSRYHIRFFFAHDNGQGTYYSVGDAHYERLVPCGHAVPPDGFDNARRHLRNIMGNGGHYTTRNYWGNTRTFLQCSFTYAGSNGYVDWAWI
jgi:hypothetical protein